MNRFEIAGDTRKMADIKSQIKITPAPLDASRLVIRRRKDLQPVGWLQDPPTGVQSAGTDHMLTVRWNEVDGWATPEIVPYADLAIPPTASCIHYATQCYEGLKVYRGYDGRLRIFRPDANCKRLVKSAVQVSLPTFDTKELERLIISLLAVDCPKWLPAATCKGKSLYVRPAMIANGPTIGVRLPGEALLFVILVPWPEIAPELVTNGLQLITSRAESVRAWPGGFGSTKIGANYGPSFVSLGEARSLGFDQVLWLFGESGFVTEAGASNFYVIWKTDTGKVELVTASLDDKVILPGITRDSIITLAQKRLSSSTARNYSHRPLEVVERQFSMTEIAAAKKEGRLIEAFVSGTAVSDNSHQ